MRFAGLTAAFAAFLGAIIALADTGHLGPLLRGVHEIPAADKIGHFVLMGVLSWLVNQTLGGARWRVGGHPFLVGSAVVAVIVTIEECTQHFIATRSFSLLDLAANYAGIIVLGRWILPGAAAG